jgi:hypothetical protein
MNVCQPARILLTLFLPLIIFSCSKKSISQLEDQGLKVTQGSITVGQNRVGEEFRLQYLGCGGIFLRHDNQSIMFDPFFSNQKFGKIGRSILFGAKIRSKPECIEIGKERIKKGLQISDDQIRDQTKAIFNAHSHYDHAMDIPFVQKYWLNNNASVFMNESGMKTCEKVIPVDKLFNIETKLSARESIGGSFDFPSTDGTVLKIYPILAAHNPHSRNMKLFSGTAMGPPSSFNEPTDKTRVTDWLEGRTISFLIDVVKKDDILYRIFLQSSSASFPDGIPPLRLLEQKKVDLAILGSASFHYSENTYPCEYINKLSATELMFIHWEDFFQRYDKETKSLRKQNLPRLMNEVLPKCRKDYILPVPGSVITIRY